MSKLWTKEEITKLVELKQNNVSYDEIATILGRTTKSVTNKISNLGLGEKLNYWTEEEDTLLIENLNTFSLAEIAIMLGRTRRSVSSRVSHLGLTNDPHKKWSEEEIDILTKLRREGTPAKEIAIYLDRTEASVYSKASSLGLDKKVDFWTKEEDNYLFECINNNMSYDEISNILGRTKKSVTNRVSLLGIANEPHKKWSEEDIKKLEELHSIGVSYADISKELDRSIHAISTKVHKSTDITNRLRVWTNTEDELLKSCVELWKSKEEICELLNRTKSAIIGRITYLGIGKPKNKSQEQFVLDVKNKFSNIEVLGTYSTARTKVLVKYVDCGHTAEIEPNGLLSSSVNSHCRICFPKGTSKGQLEVEEFLKDLEVNFISKDREVLNGKELDIFIPDYLLGIEYNGEYWHSDSAKNHDNLHIKTTLANNAAIDLIHIWEHEWKEKNAIVKSRLAGILGLNQKIFARKTTLKTISWAEAKEFLDRCHIQGGGSPTNINLSLYLGEELVAVMTFGKPRFNTNYEYELVRYCSTLNTNVIGGASKLLKHFVKIHNPKSIVSYSDRRWGRGNLYRKLGFTLTMESKPNYFYFKGTTKISRYQAQKHKLEKLIPEYYDSDKTESEMMRGAGYVKCYDCGNYVWSLIV